MPNCSGIGLESHCFLTEDIYFTCLLFVKKLQERKTDLVSRLPKRPLYFSLHKGVFSSALALTAENLDQ